MALFRRLSTLARADAHGVVDALEDRRLLVRQHVREAAEALEAKRARLDALDAEDRDLERSAARITTAVEGLESDIELGLAEGRDDLARFSIERLLPLRRRLERTAERRRQIEEDRAELYQQVESQAAELHELRARAKAFLERPDGEDPLGPAPVVSAEEVELELLRRRAAGPRDDRAGDAARDSGEVTA